MIIDKIVNIYFSPTHSTEKIVNSILKGMGIGDQRVINLNSLKQRYSVRFHFLPSEVVILGIPVYEERIPTLLYPVLYKIKGQHQLMILVVTYGNISPGIALKQLYGIMSDQGFKITAAASFIGEHSFSVADTKFAPGRPDNQDLKKAVLFGEQIHKKIKSAKKIEDIQELHIGGKLLSMGRFLPKHSEMLFAHAPDINQQLCQRCYQCLESCPVNAIDSFSLKSREKLCIRCFACVRHCPTNARKVVFKRAILVRTLLKKLAKKRKEPKIYI